MGRWMRDVDAYIWHFGGNGRSLLLQRYFSSSLPSKMLGTYDLPQPLPVGDRAVLELRIVGSHLTGLLNG